MGLDFFPNAPIMVDMIKTPASPTVNVTPTPQSSWIRGIGYHNGILIILTGPVGDTSKTTGALLYGNVPSWVKGLLIAAQAEAKTGESAGQESVGATYSRLVKGKYPCQTVGPERVDELRKLINKK